jgi:hypothetical protein
LLKIIYWILKKENILRITLNRIASFS